MPSTPTYRVVGYAGSLREGSFNKALLRAARDLAPDNMEIEIFDVSGIPLYNADIDAAGPPEIVLQFKQAIREADGLLVVTPEYNYSIPAVTKNAIDWASRPPNDSPLLHKPVAITGASSGMWGTLRAQQHLRQSFLFTQSFAMIRPELYVTRAREKFEDGKLTDQDTRERLVEFLDSFAAWIDRTEPEDDSD